MDLHFWMGVAAGSVFPWLLMLLVVRSNHSKTSRGEEHMQVAEELMRERNTFEKRTATALETIAKGGLE